MKRFFKKLFSANYCVNSNNVFQSGRNNSIGDNDFSEFMSTFKFKENGTSTINGKTYKGKNIEIKNNRVWVDGEEQKDSKLKEVKNISISIDGNIQSIEISDCNDLRVKGDVGKIDLNNGNIEIEGNVENGVTSKNGNIEINGNVTGNVSSVNGDVINS